jgi:uncharacterized LabA/DUF88 family protein
MSQKKPTRIAVFIDWQNLGDHKSVINTQLLRQYLDTLGAVRRCFIYLVDFHREVPEHLQRPSRFVEVLSEQGYTVRHKILNLNQDRFRNKRRRADGNLDVDLTIDVMKVLFDQSIVVDKVVLFTGDWDFCPLVKEIKNWPGKKPIKVLVIGRMGHTSQKLRLLADEFLYVEEILSQICLPEEYPIGPPRLQVLVGEPFD